MRSRALVGLASVALVALAGCASAGGASAPCASAAAPAAKSITDGDHDTAVRSITAALNAAHFQCEMKPKGILCDAGTPGRLTFVVVFVDEGPRRLVFVVPSKMKVPCGDAVERFNKFNHEIDTAVLTCDGDSFAAAGSLIVPKAGLTADDVTGYAAWWTNSLVTAFRANQTTDVIE